MADQKPKTEREKQSIDASEVGDVSDVLLLPRRQQDVVEEPTPSDPLGIMSDLIRRVDMGEMSMPAARKLLGEWYQALPDKQLAYVDGRVRMKRLRQILDSLYEQYMSITIQTVG
jgi:hypothetical protein